MIDYRELLKKYIEHVGDCEGSVFLSEMWRRKDFTDDEWSELLNLDNENCSCT